LPQTPTDVLGTEGSYVDPLWRITVELTPLERDLLRSWWVRRLGFIAHAGAAVISTNQSYSRLEHSLGLLSLVAHFTPDDRVARAAALVHDIGHLPFSHTFEGVDGLNHHALGAELVAVQVVDQRWAADRRVEVTRPHACDQVGDRQVRHVQFDRRMPLGEQAHDRRHHLVGQRGQDADAEFEVLAARASRDGVHGPLRGSQQWQRFAQQYLAGELEIEFNPQGTLAERIRAGGAGIPAFFTRTGAGTDIAKGKEEREFDGEKYIMERGIVADLSIVHAWKADTEGNLVYRKTARNFNPMMATAGKMTIAEVEELVPTGSINPDHIHTPGIFVQRILKGARYEKRIEKRTVRES